MSRRPPRSSRSDRLCPDTTLFRDTNTGQLAPEAGDDAFLSYSFEAGVCPLELASVTGVFDFDTAVISVVEEAQFRVRRVSIHRDEAAGTINMRVALTSDLGVELDLASGNAFALLESLGLHPDSVGEITIAAMRERLTNQIGREHV